MNAKAAASSDAPISEIRARVTRVVPGKLVYVEEESSAETGDGNDLAIKLDHVLIEDTEGVRPYRGEAFAEIGLKEGRLVRLAFGRPGGNDVLMVITTNPRRFQTLMHLSAASAIAAAVAGTLQIAAATGLLASIVQYLRRLF